MCIYLSLRSNSRPLLKGTLNEVPREVQRCCIDLGAESSGLAPSRARAHSRRLIITCLGSTYNNNWLSSVVSCNCSTSMSVCSCRAVYLLGRSVFTRNAFVSYIIYVLYVLYCLTEFRFNIGLFAFSLVNPKVHVMYVMHGCEVACQLLFALLSQALRNSGLKRANNNKVHL